MVGSYIVITLCVMCINQGCNGEAFLAEAEVEVEVTDFTSEDAGVNGSKGGGESGRRKKL